MSLEGIIVNGRVELTGPADLPDGTRVSIEPIEDDDLFDYGPPPEPYDKEKELAILREALEEVRQGKGMPFEECMAQIAKELNLPAIDAE